MARDKDSGKHLNSVQALEYQKDRAENERERICSFIRYVQRRANDQSAKELLRGLRQDIEDAQHYRDCYQQ